MPGMRSHISYAFHAMTKVLGTITRTYLCGANHSKTCVCVGDRLRWSSEREKPDRMLLPNIFWFSFCLLSSSAQTTTHCKWCAIRLHNFFFGMPRFFIFIFFRLFQLVFGTRHWPMQLTCSIIECASSSHRARTLRTATHSRSGSKRTKLIKFT